MTYKLSTLLLITIITIILLLVLLFTGCSAKTAIEQTEQDYFDVYYYKDISTEVIKTANQHFAYYTKDITINA